MEIVGIDVAFYHSNDMAESVRWYEDVLGMPKTADFGDWVEFNVGGPRWLHLYAAVWLGPYVMEWWLRVRLTSTLLM